VRKDESMREQAKNSNRNITTKYMQVKPRSKSDQITEA
jgi:hypothetical protein